MAFNLSNSLKKSVLVFFMALSMSSAWASLDTYGPIKATDTLWHIATSIYPHEDVSPQQVMLALQKKNPQAFKTTNINSLMRGVTLKIPSIEEVQTVAYGHALKQARHANSQWQQKTTTAKSERAPARDQTAQAQSASTRTAATSLDTTTLAQTPQAQLTSQVNTPPTTDAATTVTAAATRIAVPDNADLFQANIPAVSTQTPSPTHVASLPPSTESQAKSTDHSLSLQAPTTIPSSRATSPEQPLVLFSQNTHNLAESVSAHPSTPHAHAMSRPHAVVQAANALLQEMQAMRNNLALPTRTPASTASTTPSAATYPSSKPLRLAHTRYTSNTPTPPLVTAAPAAQTQQLQHQVGQLQHRVQHLKAYAQRLKQASASTGAAALHVGGLVTTALQQRLPHNDNWQLAIALACVGILLLLIWSVSSGTQQEEVYVVSSAQPAPVATPPKGAGVDLSVLARTRAEREQSTVPAAPEKTPPMTEEQTAAALEDEEEDLDDEKDEYDFMGSEEGIPAKLDLARAYIAMQDVPAAKSVLVEILNKGSERQQQQAEELLAELKSKIQ